MKELDLQRLIPDDGLRNYIVENTWGDDPFGEAKNYYIMMDAIVNLSFIYSFSCYTDMRNRNVSIDGELGDLDKCIRNGNANSLRVIKTFDKIYSEYPISNELIQFVLFDIQFDFLLGEESKLISCFPNCVQPVAFRLNDYFTMINKARFTERNFDHDISFLEEKLVNLINYFAFLGRTKLQYDEDSGWYVFKIQSNHIFKNGIIYTYGLINRLKVTRKRSRFFYLADINKRLLRYENLRGSQKCFLTDNIEQKAGDVIEKPYELPWDVESVYTYLAPHLFDAKNIDFGNYHLYNVNYKYLKHLSLAISDALGRDDYKESYIKLQQEFSETIKQLQDKSDIDLAVLMLLIENSPSIILNALIKMDARIAYRIVNNLKNRLGTIIEEKIGFIQSKNDFEEYIDNLIEFDQMRIGNRSIETDVGKFLIEKLKIEAKTNFILSILSAIDDNNRLFKVSNFIGQSLESLEKENESKQTSGNYLWQTITITLGTILKRLICFYSGIFAYGKNKIKYDALSEYSLPSKEMIQHYQKECQKGFEEETKKTWDEIKGTEDLVEILRLFIDVCGKCKDYDDSYQGRSDESRCLYAVLGKYHIIDMDVFTREIPSMDTIEPLTAESSDNTVRWWLKEAIRLIRFLATGEFEELNERELSKCFLHSINPLIASGYRSNSGRDGYDATTFFLTMDVKGNNIVDFQYEINILSEFSYDMNKKYYCLPNILRSSEKWWIDPLLISCEVIDDIFKKE